LVRCAGARLVCTPERQFTNTQIDLQNVRRRLPGNRTSSLEWSGEGPDERTIDRSKGGKHAFQRRGETSKILASGGLCAGALVPVPIGTGVGAVLGYPRQHDLYLGRQHLFHRHQRKYQQHPHQHHASVGRHVAVGSAGRPRSSSRPGSLSWPGQAALTPSMPLIPGA